MNAAQRIRRLLARPFSRRPFALQRLRWPNPLRPPYLQSEITLHRSGELGDIVMCLAVVRAIRERNPRACITFVTQARYVELLRDHPLLDRVLTEEEAASAGLRAIVALRYEAFIPLRLHVIDYFAGCVGLREIPHEIPLPNFTGELGPLAPLLPAGRPRVMVCRQAGPFTPNKDWPAERWTALLAALPANATVIELGAQAATAQPEKTSANYIDLRGRTTLRQFCALLSLADLVITPVTSAVHIAAAYGVRTLSVAGGYESPANTAYPRHMTIQRGAPCAPCWLRTPCPYDVKCLRAVGVAEVAAAASALLRQGPAPS